MRKFWRYAAFFISFTVLFTACSNSFKPGQTVWIDLPNEGYAIAKVIRMQNDKARLRVVKINATKNGKLVRLLKRKRVLISPSQLKPVKEGRTAWKKRIAAIRARRLDNMLSMMTSKNQYKGKTKYKNKTLHFQIKISKYNAKNGRFSGRITWPQRKKAVHKIKGQINKKKLSMKFQSLAVIKPGSWKTGNKFNFSMANATAMTGTVIYKVLFFPVKKPATIALK